MRSFPIFRAWVRTWRYRLRRDATPTVSRSATTPAPPETLVTPLNNSASTRLAAVALRPRDLPPERVLGNEVDERALPVDLDHWQPLAVVLLELRIPGDVDLVELEAELLAQRVQRLARAVAQMAALRPEQGHASGRQRAAALPAVSRGREKRRAPSGIQTASRGRLGDALDGEAVGRHAHARLVALGGFPGLREGPDGDVVQLRVHLVLLPEVLLQALHPLEIRDDHA